MQQTIKHICIFMIFCTCVLLWDEARAYSRHILPRFHREGMTLFIWSTVVVAIWHLLFHYLGSISERAVYIITLVAVLAAMIGYDVINVF